MIQTLFLRIVMQPILIFVSNDFAGHHLPESINRQTSTRPIVDLRVEF